MKSSPQLIARVLAAFLVIYQKESNRFDKRDVENINKTNHWRVERYVLVHKTEDEALKALTTTMEWRKSFGVNDLDEKMVKDIKPGMFAIDGKDKKGRPVLWSKPELLKRSEGGQQRQRVKQLKIYNLEKMDKQYPNEGWNFAMDYSKTIRENVDMEYYFFLVKVYMVYYPRSVKFVLLNNIPTALEDVPKILVEMMDQELKNRMKFTKYKELIDNYIDAKDLPSFVSRT